MQHLRNIANSKMRSTQFTAFRNKALPFARRLKCVVSASSVQDAGIVRLYQCSETV
jgi:hypothetical protein